MLISKPVINVTVTVSNRMFVLHIWLPCSASIVQTIIKRALCWLISLRSIRGLADSVKKRT
jgi:hypothetical protein